MMSGRFYGLSVIYTLKLIIKSVLGIPSILKHERYCSWL